MAKKKSKNAAAVAGVVVAAAVAASGIGGPSEGDFSGSMEGLETAVVGLVDKSTERGMELPQSPGINDVTAGMNGMAPTKGTTRTVRVASGGEIAKGDYIKVCEELDALESKTFATGGVRVVAVTSNGVNGVNCEDRPGYLVAILYAKSGKTYLRIATVGENGGVSFSNTLTIEDVELENADIALDHNGKQLVVVYNKDGDGWMSRVGYTASSNRATLTWSAKWRQGGDPTNICMAYDSFSDFMCVCSTVLPDGSQNESERYAVLEEMYICDTGAVISPTPCVLTAEEYPCLYGMDYSTAPSNNGWDIAYTANWYDDMMARMALGEEYQDIIEDEQKYFVIHVTYPMAHGGRGLIVVDHYGTEMVCCARNYVECAVPGQSSSSTVALDVGATTAAMGYVAMTDVVHSASLGGKNYLFIETYTLYQDGVKLVGSMRSRPEEVYDTPLENVSYALMDKEIAIGYTVGQAAYVQVNELQRSGAVFGPAIKVADGVAGCARVVPVSGDMVACVYADSNGAGHIVPLRKTRVVAKERADMAAWAVGTALESGEAGENIRADLNYWPDEQW